MEEIVFALAIPHTPWVPERVKSMASLKAQLGNRPVYYKEFSEREPNWSWSQKLWDWAAHTDATHLVQLQDDVRVMGCFWPELRKMVEAVPDAMIGLESVFDPGGTWYTSGDGMIGVGYVIPIWMLQVFLEWRGKLRPGAIQELNEDQMLGLFAYDTRQPIWHPVPTLIDHDTSLPSSYGNDEHTHRRPEKSAVRGDALPQSWAVPKQYQSIPRMYRATPFLCRRHVMGYSFDRYVEDMK